MHTLARGGQISAIDSDSSLVASCSSRRSYQHGLHMGPFYFGAAVLVIEV